MGLFQIFYGNLAIGESALEGGDPPMGIVHGRFIPFESFDEFKHSTSPISDQPLMDKDQNRWEGLTIKTSEGMVIPCSQGVVINAFGSIDELLEMEVTCLGVSVKLYEELFPQHIEAYKNSF